MDNLPKEVLEDTLKNKGWIAREKLKKFLKILLSWLKKLNRLERSSQALLKTNYLNLKLFYLLGLSD